MEDAVSYPVEGLIPVLRNDNSVSDSLPDKPTVQNNSAVYTNAVLDGRVRENPLSRLFLHATDFF